MIKLDPLRAIVSDTYEVRLNRLLQRFAGSSWNCLDMLRFTMCLLQQGVLRASTSMIEKPL